MCLLVNKKVRNNHHKEDGYCVAYKVIRLWDNSTLFVRSHDFFYKVGENIPCEPSYIFNKKYCYAERVEYGLHLFLDKSIAKGLISYYERTYPDAGENIKIIKVYYKPEDVIAYGFSNTFSNSYGEGGEKSVVVRKLTIKSLDPIK